MATYPAILDGSGDVWGVRFPDLPGCYGGGPTAGAAIKDATSAAVEWVASSLQHDDDVPPPSTVETLAPLLTAGETLMLIPVLVDGGRQVRANISMDSGLLKMIDEAAERRGVTRSAFLAGAAKDKIFNEG
jgi:predicted RNase H-like HicB family nuclease